MVLGNCEGSIVEWETIVLTAGVFLMGRRSCKVAHWIQHWIEHWAQLGDNCAGGGKMSRIFVSVRRFINSPEIL